MTRLAEAYDARVPWASYAAALFEFDPTVPEREEARRRYLALRADAERDDSTHVAVDRPKRILVTGSRAFCDEGMLRRRLRDAWFGLGAGADVVLVTVGGELGAEGIAEQMWRESRLPVEHFGGVDDVFELGVDVCLVFSVGDAAEARDVVRRAQTAGVDVHVYEEMG